MPVVMREEQKIARRDLHLLAPVREPRQARALGQKMEEHAVVRARQAACGRRQPVLRMDAPGGLELGFDIDEPSSRMAARMSDRASTECSSSRASPMPSASVRPASLRYGGVCGRARCVARGPYS